MLYGFLGYDKGQTGQVGVPFDLINEDGEQEVLSPMGYPQAVLI